MKFTYTKIPIKLKNREISVIIPENIEGFLNNKFVFDADRKGLNAIMLSAFMMIKEKNIIIYFPLQKNDNADYWGNLNSTIVSEKPVYDVVFMHHSTQISVSKWKKIKQSFKYGKNIRKSVKVNIDLEYELYESKYKKFEKTENYYKKQDVFSHCYKYDTCFFVGGTYSFMQLFTDLKKMLELPLEENFKKASECDYIYFLENGKKCGYDFPELGFFDKTIIKVN